MLCYSSRSHENSLSWLFFPMRILTNIFEILHIIHIIPKVNQHLQRNKIDQSSVTSRRELGIS